MKGRTRFEEIRGGGICDMAHKGDGHPCKHEPVSYTQEVRIDIHLRMFMSLFIYKHSVSVEFEMKSLVAIRQTASRSERHMCECQWPWARSEIIYKLEDASS